MSKIAEKIAGEVLAHGFVYQWNKGSNVSFADAVDRVLEGKIISKSEVDALRKDANAFRFAGEVAYNSINDGLKKEKENREYYLKNCGLESRIAELNGKISDLERRNAQQSTWLTEAWPLSNQVPSLKDKLWEAEQEIHDLKNEVDSQSHDIDRLELELIDEMEENDRVTDDWEALVQEQKKVISSLQEESHLLRIRLHLAEDVIYKIDSSQSEQTEKPAETIEPPSCLKPADALSWTSTQVYGGSENNAFHFDGKPCRDVNCDWQKNSHSFYTYIKPKSATLETKVYGSTPGPGTSPVLTELCWVKGCKYFGLKHPPVSSQSEQEKPGAAPNVGTW